MTSFVRASRLARSSAAPLRPTALSALRISVSAFAACSSAPRSLPSLNQFSRVALLQSTRAYVQSSTPATFAIDPDSPVPDFSYDPKNFGEPGKPFEVCMIGAGGINFGTKEGPWNHSVRLEHKLGPRLRVTALIDPDAARSEAVLKGKRESFVREAYECTKHYPNLEAYIADLAKNKSRPDAVIVGAPPSFHGSMLAGHNMEDQLVKALPGVPMFIEKPISTSTVDDAYQVGDILRRNGAIVSVGYMMRYLQAVQKMKEIIITNNLTVTGTIARYAATYIHISKSHWWTKSLSCGPIVEQGTHFCDLSRYFGGDVDLDTVQAVALEHNEPPGKLGRMPVDESKIPEEERIPRMTAACWKYKNGATGTMTHTICLQGDRYSTELEVYADGFQLKLVDPYNNPTLYVRTPEDDHDRIYRFPDDDPYLSQFSHFVDAIDGRDEAIEILSPYDDAVKTYELSWAIRLASERKNTVSPFKK